MFAASALKSMVGLGLAIVAVLVVASPAYAATLAVDPAVETASVGETFDIDITLALDGESVKGVDALLTYNPATLQVVSISNGEIFAEIVKNFNNTDGSLSVSASSTTPITLDGTLAKVTLKAKAAGSAALNFDFTSGSKIDSNVLESSTTAADLLTAVTNGMYVFTISTATTASTTPTTGIGGESDGTTVAAVTTPQLPQAGHAENVVILLSFGAGLMLTGWMIQWQRRS